MENIDQVSKDHYNLALDGHVDNVDLVSMVRNSQALVLSSRVQVVDQISKVLSSQVEDIARSQRTFIIWL